MGPEPGRLSEAGVIGNQNDLLIFVVDSDAAVRDSVASLVRSLGGRPLCFQSAEECLQSINGLVPECLVTEVSLPGMDGLALLDHLHESGINTPTIFLALESSVSAAVRAMRSGAIDYIEKPFIDRQLASRIKELCAIQQ